MTSRWGGNKSSSGVAGSLNVAELQSVDDLVEPLGLFRGPSALGLLAKESQDVDHVGRLSKIARNRAAGGLGHSLERGCSYTGEHHEEANQARLSVTRLSMTRLRPLGSRRLGRARRLGCGRRLGRRHRIFGTSPAVTDVKSWIGLTFAHCCLRSIRGKSLLYNRLTVR